MEFLAYPSIERNGGIFMRKALAACLAVCLMAFGCGYAMTEPSAMETKSSSAVLMEQGTGNILFENNADEQMSAAGCAKVMTMLLVFEAIDDGRLTLDEQITVSQTAASMGGTQAFLEANASYKAEDLLKGLCVASANDAAIAFAEKLFGSEEVMVQKMNERAQALGCTNTTFVDAVGLKDETVTTARDLALLAKALCEYRNVFPYTSVYQDSLTHGTGRVTELVNANRMVRFYGNCDGLATGSSAKARYGVAATAKKGDMRLIAVALGSTDSSGRFDDAKTMLDYGFANYTSKVVVRKGETLKKEMKIEGGSPHTIDVVAGEEVRLVMNKGEEKTLEKELVLQEGLQAPIQKGQQIGEVIIKQNGAELCRTPAVSAGDITQLNLMECVRRIAKWWIH